MNTLTKSHTLGTGALEIQVWLDYICPYSKKQFDKLYTDIHPAVEARYPNKFRFVFMHQPQPWHGQGSYLHEAALAASRIDPKSFWEFSKELFSVSESYYDVYTWDKSRKQIIDELADLAAKVNIPRAKFLEFTTIDLNGEAKNPGPRVVDDMKYYIKVGRQNGIHVSPTVVINGLIDNAISSSWTTEQWLDHLSRINLD